MRVGDTDAEPVDIRVLAATNRDLEEEIKAGRFREDLYYRLNVVHLAAAAAARARRRHPRARALPGGALRARVRRQGARADAATRSPRIKRHRWPGNIRELENRIKKAVVLCGQGAARPRGPGPARPTICRRSCRSPRRRSKFQRDYINEVLELNNGNRTKTARDLGVDPRTIFRHLEKEDGGELRPDERRKARSVMILATRNDCSGADSNVSVAGAPMGAGERDPAPLHPGTSRA